VTSQAEVQAWIEKYVLAWTSAERADIEALFTADAEYHERPYETD
jgi:hypothetical protein